MTAIGLSRPTRRLHPAIVLKSRCCRTAAARCATLKIRTARCSCSLPVSGGNSPSACYGLLEMRAPAERRPGGFSLAPAIRQAFHDCINRDAFPDYFGRISAVQEDRAEDGGAR